MEENIKKTKENALNTQVLNEAKENKKISYEQLEQVAHQLSEQTRQLYSQLQKSNLENMFKRLDYLFKVVELNKHFSMDFYKMCVNEIENLMTIPEEKDTEDNKETTEIK